MQSHTQLATPVHSSAEGVTSCCVDSPPIATSTAHRWAASLLSPLSSAPLSAVLQCAGEICRRSIVDGEQQRQTEKNEGADVVDATLAWIGLQSAQRVDMGMDKLIGNKVGRP